MDILSTSLVLGTFACSFLGVMLLFKGRSNKISIIYTLHILSILLWTVGLFFFIHSDNPREMFIWTKIGYASGIIIAASFLFFTHFFPYQDKKLHLVRRTLWVFVPGLLVGYLVIGTRLIIRNVQGTGHELEYGPWKAVFGLFILSYFCIGFYKLYMKGKQSRDRNVKKQIRLFLPSYIIAAAIAFISNVVLTSGGIHSFNIYIGPSIGVCMAAYATYLIFKFRLFDGRVATTELLTFALWIFILIQTLFARTFEDRLVYLVLLFLCIIFGIFLIMSIIQEEWQRSEIEQLAKGLAASNEELLGLDRMKSEFVSLATHQIRTPLSTIKGYASIMLEGDRGDVPAGFKEPLEAIFQASEKLTMITNEIFDVSRLEQGILTYDIVNFDLAGLAQEVFKALASRAEQNDLVYTFEHKDGEAFEVYADRLKTKQVLFSIIDNAVKYTPHGGMITVSLSSRGNVKRLCVRDSGIGVDPADQKKIFGKFVRTNETRNVDVTGSGLGLYIAKRMIDAQEGKIWVESDGKGKGAAFYIELPARTKGKRHGSA